MNLLSKLIFSLAIITSTASAQIRLPKLVSDGMVLQRDTKVNVWGWAAVGEKVTVKFNKKTYNTTTKADGKWIVILNAAKAGGPYTMEITASNHIVLKNILLGDVWFCSGQSNMTVLMERVKEKYPDEIKNANYPQIRNFFVPTLADVSKIHDDLPPGKWAEATAENIMGFAAVPYFFAKKIYLKYHVPIGIINSSVGGTPIQAWISENGFKSMPDYSSRIAKFKDTSFIRQISRSPVINSNNKPFLLPDKGLAGAVKWYDTSFIAQNWHPFFLPGYWADQGVKSLNGVIWFRKEIEVPASMAGKPAKLFMGRIVDADETYLNGVKVGNITYQYPPRRYEVPAGLLKSGKNLIVVRLTNTFGKGGFVPDKRYELTDGTNKIDLRGDWQYQVGQVFPPLRRSVGDVESGFAFSAQNEPTGLYNTMVAPAIQYNVKGFLWYQGETNTGKPQEYRQLLRNLITDWRQKFSTPDAPFIFAQLPNFMEVQYSPSESQWAEMRESQRQTLSVPNTAMAVTIDVGEWNDIHPLNKKDVGERMALAAEKMAYGDAKLVSSGPAYQSAKIEGDKITINFNSIGKGLIAKDGGELNQFAIAGVDKRYVWADAKITGNQVIVSSAQVPNPMYVRYAWADNPEGANLYNQEGLPASPFTTDTK
ncbi:MAG: sialate O-acetylesterase [Sphingobacteriaceae bacterium]|nr:MAG: sialate O-acetylesterase [Sphingobacteriaceae bacterium]